MRSPTPLTLFVLVVSCVACASRDEPPVDPPSSTSEHVLVGQLRLPEGIGSRGVEVVISVHDGGGERRRIWVLFDEEGRFSSPLSGALTEVTVSTGLHEVLHRIGGDALPRADATGCIDVGVIDLRDRLVSRPLMLRAAPGAPPGDVRIALCFGPPPTGPQGENVSLGSRQFPEVALGISVDWLLPHGAKGIHFLVERPADAERGNKWRTGRQQLFGPFALEEIPSELRVD
ncbi:MAG: hypothetical protein KDC38_18005 [Planctomycetes bacterium]|nr:hypothetical protein [Planctomycetota bacterium]